MDEALSQFLAGPDPNTLPVASVGTCKFCQHHGPGPGHDCAVWNKHHPKTPPPKPEPKAFDRTRSTHVPWSQAATLDPISLARVTIELLRGIEWHQNGGGTYTCPAEGSWTFAKTHWEDCALASVLAHAEATFAALNVPRKHRITVRRSTVEELQHVCVDGRKVAAVFRLDGRPAADRTVPGWRWMLDARRDLGLVDAQGDAPDAATARKAAVKHIRKCLATWARKVRIESSPIGGIDILVGDVIVGNVREDRYRWWRWTIDPNPLGIEPRSWPQERTQQEATLAAVRYVEAQLGAKESPK